MGRLLLLHVDGCSEHHFQCLPSCLDTFFALIKFGKLTSLFPFALKHIFTFRKKKLLCCSMLSYCTNFSFENALRCLQLSQGACQKLLVILFLPSKPLNLQAVEIISVVTQSAKMHVLGKYICFQIRLLKLDIRKPSIILIIECQGHLILHLVQEDYAEIV